MALQLLPINIFNYEMVAFLSFKDKAHVALLSKTTREYLKQNRNFTEFNTQVTAGRIVFKDTDPNLKDTDPNLKKWKIERLENYSDPLINALGGVTALMGLPEHEYYEGWLVQDESAYPSIKTENVVGNTESVFFNYFNIKGEHFTTLLSTFDQSWESINSGTSDFCCNNNATKKKCANCNFRPVGEKDFQEIRKLVQGTHPHYTLQKPTIQETDTLQVEKDTSTTTSV
jgi:hypothetical protein